jgi:hypothetical protein
MDEITGRRRYFDLPDHLRVAAVADAYRRVDQCLNGESRAHYRGVIAEHQAAKWSCGKSAVLCGHEGCNCAFPSAD